jgi:hypothetical protein
MCNVEMTRESFKPDKIKLLFIGESAPAGGNFFYYGNSNMTAFMKRAFEEAFGPMDNFLYGFKSMGCYLDDLVLVPVNGLARAERTRHCVSSKDDLSRRIRANRPDVVVCLMKGIGHIVSDAARTAGVERFYCTHFPGNGQQGKFAEDMRVILADHRSILTAYV